MGEERINLLARKWRDGTMTEAERREFEQWYASFDDSEPEIPSGETPAELERRMYQAISRKKESGSRGRKTGLWRRAVAALILISLFAGTYFLISRQTPDQQPAVHYENDIPPGGNRATLTLADGSTIVLDEAQAGELAEEAGTRVVKLDSGSLAYSHSGKAEQSSYNTLTTPRGGQFRVTLPDGTGVWLNAASSITYPTVFTGTERRIELKGEAYFEVAPDQTRPFRVHTASADGKAQVVEVLGTHFNINAYPDETEVQTTLLEGSVVVRAGSRGSGAKSGETSNLPAGRQAPSTKRLKPGQQAVLEGGTLSVRAVDTQQFTAWKNGLFQFRDASLKAVMRQLARWYDVEVVYEGTVPERTFSGKIYRNISASQALELLRFTKVNFRIETPRAGGQEKKIVVIP